MALWQYTFHLLPKESVDILSSDYCFKKDEDEFDDEPYWKYSPINKDFFDEMNKILPMNKSWSNKIYLYGYQESNCVEVFVENDNVISVSFRIDFTSNYESLLSEIIEFCLQKKLIIIDETLVIVPQNITIANNIIQNSPQVKEYNRLLKLGK